MQFYQLFFLVGILAHCPIVLSKLSTINWFSCSAFTYSDERSSGHPNAEGAIYNAPLCYPGICETPEFFNLTVEVFVKRFPAVKNSTIATNLWLLQGGPGASSVHMESSMVDLYKQFGGAVNVYTIDYRGTKRSTFLKCLDGGASFQLSDIPDCAEELHAKYGDLASFSVTTAATDVATLISKHSNGATTIVNGVSFGTAVVECLIHLAPASVTGYVLDSLTTASGTMKDKFMYFSRLDDNFNEVGEAFLELCQHDPECEARFNLNASRVHSTISSRSLTTNRLRPARG